MKKLFTLVMSLLAVCTMNAADVIFTADLDTEAGFNQWTVVDNNNDEKTWIFSQDNDDGQHVYYQYHSTNSADDWLISPVITPPASEKIVIRYTLKGSYYKEAAEVRICYGNETDVSKFTEVLNTHNDLDDSDHSFVSIIESAPESFRVAVRATSEPNRWRLYLKSFSVEATDDLCDLTVTDILTPTTGENLGQEPVRVSIKNEGLTPADEFDATLIVNGETIATEHVIYELLPDKTLDFTFQAKADLSKPRELYDVTVAVDYPNDINPGNNSRTVQVRHKAPATVPYFTGFEPGEYLDECKSFNLNEDSGDWAIGVGSVWFSMARTGIGYLGYNYDKTNNADDWFILEPIKVDAGYYALKFWYSGDDSHPEKFSVHYGNSGSPEAMTNKIVEYAPFAKGAYQESINILHFDEPQTVYIGFYAFSDKDENWITIDDLSFERIEATDIDVAAISVINPTEYLPVQAPQDITFTAKNLGITAQDVTVSFKVDDTVVNTSTVNFAAQEEKKLNYADALNGLEPGEHTVEVAVTCEGDIKHENDAISQSFIFIGTPDIIYDFESGIVPADFTYEVNDEGTLNASAVEEFGENGWGIVSIGDHPYYGTKMFAGSSWVDGVEDINRSCILPKVKVNSENAYFVWNAGSINPYFYESYQVRVRYIDPVWGEDYSKLAEITLEGTDRQYRGISLGKFNGQEVQVEICMTSKPGDALTLDNLQFVGCSLLNPSGIEESKVGNNLKIAVANNCVTVSDNATITVTDMNGRTVASGIGSTLAISHLTPGAYIVKARTNTDTNTIKFIK